MSMYENIEDFASDNKDLISHITTLSLIVKEEMSNLDGDFDTFDVRGDIFDAKQRLNEYTIQFMDEVRKNVKNPRETKVRMFLHKLMNQ